MVIIRDYSDLDYEDVKLNLLEGKLFNHDLDTSEILKRKIERNPGSIIVADIDNHAIGNVYTIEDFWNSFIFRLAVRKQYRRQGIGTMLLNEAEKRLKDKGIKEISLCIAENELDRLSNYYQNRGYIPMEWKHQFMYKVL